MAGSIIENMSGKKLTIIGSVLLVYQVATFLLGAIIAPKPNGTDQFTATKCYNKEGGTLSTGWFYPRGEGFCTKLDKLDDQFVLDNHLTANNVVFSFQIPHPRDGQQIDYSRYTDVSSPFLAGNQLYDL